MNESWLIPLIAFAASLLTFFSGFGLGTLLAPAFMLFYPIETAIALTGIVHFVNGVFKLLLVGKHADRAVVLRFGVPAMVAALAGAWLLLRVSAFQEPLYTVSLGGSTRQVLPLGALTGLLLLLFALLEALPSLKKLAFERDKLPLGGLLSGFFGGLSGHQGALRSAFLIRAGLSKEAFIGSGVVVAAMIDITRIGVYASHFDRATLGDRSEILLAAIGAAIAGALLGNRLLKKVTLGAVQALVSVLLLLMAAALLLGLI